MRQDILHVNGNRLVLNIHIESRNNATVRFGKTGVNIRIPRHVSKKEKERLIREFTEWARQTVERNPALLVAEPEPVYGHGQCVQAYGRTYRLSISESKRQSGAARIRDRVLDITIPRDLPDRNRNRLVDTLISRCLARDLGPAVTARVHELNGLHFGHSIRSVQLKNLQTRWGSCSHEGNINLATRLLCAPPHVVDYVIVHELAHVNQLDHSASFWRLVEQAMPDYKDRVKWFKRNGARCGFDFGLHDSPWDQEPVLPGLRPAPVAKQREAALEAPERCKQSTPPYDVIEQLNFSFDF